jgi:twitching motility protein PilI
LEATPSQPPTDRGMARRGDPLALLLEIERRSHACSSDLPRQVETRAQWTGIAFRVGGMDLVTPIGDVTETLRLRAVTGVPGTKTWLKGIANVRGTLLPIVDLLDFLTGKVIVLGKRSRILVIHQAPVMVGLLVDEVVGLRHFFEDDRLAQPLELTGMTQKFTRSSYRDGSLIRSVFDLRELAQSGEFLQVSV